MSSSRHSTRTAAAAAAAKLNVYNLGSESECGGEAESGNEEEELSDASVAPAAKKSRSRHHTTSTSANTTYMQQAMLDRINNMEAELNFLRQAPSSTCSVSASAPPSSTLSIINPTPPLIPSLNLADTTSFYRSGDSLWSSYLLPLPQQTIADTSRGIYLHISSYIRPSLTKLTSASRPLSSSTSAMYEITSWGQFLTAFHTGLIPASIHSLSGAQAAERELDLLRFGRRLDSIYSQLGWERTISFCEQVRGFKMTSDPINYILSGDCDFDRNLFNRFQGDPNFGRQRQHRDFTSNPSRSSGTSTNATAHGVCINYNKNVNHEYSTCRYHHVCMQCHAPNMKQGHSGCKLFPSYELPARSTSSFSSSSSTKSSSSRPHTLKPASTSSAPSLAQ